MSAAAANKNASKVKVIRRAPTAAAQAQQLLETLAVTPIPRGLPQALPDYDRINRFMWSVGRYQGTYQGRPFEWILPNHQQFPQFINRHFGEFRLPERLPTSSNKLALLPHQRFPRTYLSAESPYRGLLLYWGKGSGKTRGSIEIAIPLWQLGWRIVFLSTGGLRDNFLQEWRLWTGVNGVNEFRFADLHDARTQERFRVHTITYNHPTVIENMRKLRLDSPDAPPTLLIIDEVHNLISQMTKSYNKSAKKLYQILMNFRHGKIVALSDSPFINSAYELGLLANILRGPICKPVSGGTATELCAPAVNGNPLHPGDTLFPYDEEDFDNLYVDYQEAQIKHQAADLFRIRIQGLVSNYRGIPETGVYPALIGPTLVLVYMSSYQLLVYVQARQAELERERVVETRRRQGQGNPPPGNATQPARKPKEGNTFKVRSRQVSNFAFPPGIDRPQAKVAARRPATTSGAEGSEATTPASPSAPSTGNAAEQEELAIAAAVADLEPEAAPADQSYLERIQKALQQMTAMRGDGKVGWRHDIFARHRLGFYSPKFLKCLEIMEAGEPMVLENPAEQEAKTIPVRYLTIDAHNREVEVQARIPGGNVFLYSNFRNLEGIDLFSKTLEYYGYVKAAVTVSSGLAELPAGVPRYAFISGDEDTALRTNIISLFNHHSNRYGQHLKVLLGTSAATEGISLRNVRQVFILEPHWNRVRVDQAIGRARRVNSHADLPPLEQVVTAYELQAILRPGALDKILTARELPLEEVTTTDQAIYAIAKKKDEIGRQFLRLIKESANDCRLNKPHNSVVDPDEIICTDFGDQPPDALAYGLPYDSNFVVTKRAAIKCVVYPPGGQTQSLLQAKPTDTVAYYWRQQLLDDKGTPRYCYQPRSDTDKRPRTFRVQVIPPPLKGPASAPLPLGTRLTFEEGLPLFRARSGKGERDKWVVFSAPGLKNPLPRLYDDGEVTVLTTS